MDMLEGIRARFDSVPFHQTLGMTLVSVEAGVFRAVLANSGGLMGNEHTQVLHGGVIASMIDSIGAFVAGNAARERLEAAGEPVERLFKLATVDMRVDYLAPGRGSRFVVSGQALKVGSRSAFCRMEVVADGERLIGAGSASYLY